MTRFIDEIPTLDFGVSSQSRPYVRMSIVQPYSTGDQNDAVREYAVQRGDEIART